MKKKIYCSECQYNKPGHLVCGTFEWKGTFYTNINNNCSGCRKASIWKKVKHKLWVWFSWFPEG